MDGLFTHYINDIYLRFRELNKIAEQHWREELSIAYIHHFTVVNWVDKPRKDGIFSKIRSIQRVHHKLFILAAKV